MHSCRAVQFDGDIAGHCCHLKQVKQVSFSVDIVSNCLATLRCCGAMFAQCSTDGWWTLALLRKPAHRCSFVVHLSQAAISIAALDISSAVLSFIYAALIGNSICLIDSCTGNSRVVHVVSQMDMKLMRASIQSTSGEGTYLTTLVP